MLENPPYRDDTTGNKDSNSKRNYEDSYIKINILNEIQKIKNYNKQFTYGLYQIDTELNICFKYDKNNNKIFPDNENYTKIKSKICYEYVGLNSNIFSLKKNLEKYYKDYIQDKLFKYELLK